MKPIIALLVSFIGAAVANPIADTAPGLLARNCQVAFICEAPASISVCGPLTLSCSGPGTHPVSSDPTCTANCFCGC
ncbi:hypothetical protein B0H17DRAFT_1103813 [Mycena rosella]|uniref:Uncharacterized protein n=1 Tax=Mycena rosella TaxID=1033263 RepID=A0AAD7FVU5_MYCRO|nr:hypothetical protein B0H17DRAFT_1103813 [Mycena rosella]